jgi:hypothetical protein
VLLLYRSEAGRTPDAGSAMAVALPEGGCASLIDFYGVGVRYLHPRRGKAVAGQCLGGAELADLAVVMCNFLV